MPPTPTSPRLPPPQPVGQIPIATPGGAPPPVTPPTSGPHPDERLPLPAIKRQSTKMSQRLSADPKEVSIRRIPEHGDIATLREQISGEVASTSQLQSGGSASTLVGGNSTLGSFGGSGLLVGQMSDDSLFARGPLGQMSSESLFGGRGPLGQMSNDSLFGGRGPGGQMSSDSLFGSNASPYSAGGSFADDTIEMLLRKTTKGKTLKRAMTTGGITEHTEENSDGVATPPDAEEDGGVFTSKELQYVDDKLNFLLEIMYKNMKYTRAIYQSTKKSLSGPGHEIGTFHRVSALPSVNNPSGGTPSRTTHGGSPRVTHVQTGGTDMGMVMTRTATRETVGRGSVNADKVSNMLELTRYIMRQKEKKSRRTEVGTKMWRLLEDKSSSNHAKAYAFLNHLLLAASVIMACVDVIDLNVGQQRERTQNWTRPIAIAIECCFAIELLLRFIACPHPRLFWLNKYNIIDAISALPCIIRITTIISDTWNNSDEVNAILCLVPVLRLCKLLRRFETFHLLASAFKTSFQALPVILFTMMLIGLTFSAVIYYVEPRTNVSNFPSALWYVMVTMCGVAPGEPPPVTSGGKLFTVVLMLSGILYMSIPIGIVGSAFSQVWAERSRLLLLQRMRNCVERAGYTPDDLRSMFKLLDQDHDGSLDFKEFSSMLDVMQIGVEEHFIMEVFESFDADCEGSIDFRELLRGLFPQSHHNYVEKQLTEQAENMLPRKNERYSLQDSFISHRYSGIAGDRSTFQSSSVWDGRSIGRHSTDVKSVPSAMSTKRSDRPHATGTGGTDSSGTPKKELKLVPPAQTNSNDLDSIPASPAAAASRHRALAHMTRGKSASDIE